MVTSQAEAAEGNLVTIVANSNIWHEPFSKVQAGPISQLPLGLLMRTLWGLKMQSEE